MSNVRLMVRARSIEYILTCEVKPGMFDRMGGGG